MGGGREYARAAEEARSSRRAPVVFPCGPGSRTARAPRLRASSSLAPDGAKNCFSLAHQLEVDQIPAVVLGVTILIPVASPTNLDTLLIRDSHHVAGKVAESLAVVPINRLLTIHHHARRDVDSPRRIGIMLGVGPTQLGLLLGECLVLICLVSMADDNDERKGLRYFRYQLLDLQVASRQSLLRRRRKHYPVLPHPQQALKEEEPADVVR